MKKSAVICSVRDDLLELDKAHLRMNGVLVVEDLQKAYDPILEGEADCLLITDRIINERQKLDDVVKSLNTLLSINNNAETLRIIYIKETIQEDALTRLMDAYGLWDVYFNQRLKDMRTEDVLKAFSQRKVRGRRFTDTLVSSNKEIILRNAAVFAESLAAELRNNPDVATNEKFKTLLFANPELIRDMMLGFEEYKKDLVLVRKDLAAANKKLETLEHDNEHLTIKNETLTNTCKTLDLNGKSMIQAFRQLQGQYESLYNTVNQVVSVEDLSTELSVAVDVDEYAERAPIVLYLKEYTNMNYLTDYVSSFGSIVMDSLSKLTKVLVIENDLHTSRVPLYENKGFVHVSDGTNMSATVLGNLICVGNNRKLLNYLIQNSLSLDLLIIVDRTGSNKDLVFGRNVIKFSLVKNLEDAGALDLDDTNLITNDLRGQFVVEQVADYHDIASNDQLRLSAISYMNLTRKLLIFVRDWEKIAYNAIEVELPATDKRELFEEHADVGSEEL